MFESGTANTYNYDGEFELPEKAIVLCNPVASRAHAAMSQIGALQSKFSDVEITYTIDDSRQANKEAFTRHLYAKSEDERANSLIVVSGGDGTTGMAAEALWQAEEPNIRTLPLLPLAAGHINDIARMLHSGPGRRKPANYLSTARPVTVRPLECVLDDGLSQQTSQQILSGIGYVTFGLSATAAESIGGTRVPKDERTALSNTARLFRIGGVILRDCLNAKLFTIREMEDEQPHSRTDIMAANGPQMARWLRTPATLQEDAYFLTSTSSRRLPQLLATGSRLFLGMQDGELREKDYSFEAFSPAKVQVDGETHDVDANTTVTIRQSTASVTFVALGR